MFSDPQSVTYATVAKSLPAIGRGTDSSEYKFVDTDGTVYDLTLSHQFAKRSRVVARLRRDCLVDNPLITDQSIPASMTATLTIDFPNSGLLPVDAQALAKALVAWSSDANLLKLANGET